MDNMENWPVNAPNNVESVEIKREFNDDYQSELQSTLGAIKNESEGRSSKIQFEAGATVKLPILSMTKSQPKPVVYRCTGKISVQNYLRRRNARVKHRFSVTNSVSTSAEQNAVRTPQAITILPIVFADGSNGIQVVNEENEQGDENETENGESNDTRKSQPIQIDSDCDISNDVETMEVNETQKQQPKPIYYIMALKSPPVKALNNTLGQPIKQKLVTANRNMVAISDGDEMDDVSIIDQPVTNQTATNQPIVSQPVAKPPDSKPTTANPQVQQHKHQLNSSPGQNVTQFYCILCRQKLANSRTFRKHQKSLKHVANLQKQQ